MNSNATIYLPPSYTFNGKLLKNRLQQLCQPEFIGKADIETISNGRVSTQLVTRVDGVKALIVPRQVKLLDRVDHVLLSPSDHILKDKDDFLDQPRRARWLKPKPVEDLVRTSIEWDNECERVRRSWQNAFFFLEEHVRDGTIVNGLRPPQLGALHAALAHWKVTTDPATIVMPTGTGKTETMLALSVNQCLPRVLVVVPTDALREQTVSKFVTLGLLKKFGVVGPAALYPIVGILEHRLQTPEQVETFFRCCNVIVTTMNVVSGCGDDVQRRIAQMCSHLFIDEAHHIPAPTWDKFRRFFRDKAILQFTATPFRGDGKHIDGKIIFNYPLKKAQQEEYFKAINFLAVRELNIKRADETIAQAAVQQLEEDLENELRHVVMARAATIERAAQIHQIYEKLAAQHQPLLIHSKMSSAEQRDAIRKLRDGKSRIIVCVGMLGEGFDLPELKIAALHDVHKSLAITLQFIGRFTRAKSNIGDATAIANVAIPDVEQSLKNLYAQDADWNTILRYLSEGATGRQVRRSEFLDEFVNPPAEIPLQNVAPKMSTVVFRTHCDDWQIAKISEVVRESRLYTGPTVNQKNKVILFVTREFEPITWGNIKDIYNTIWNLYLLHWDVNRNLLFINSSNNDSLHEELAQAVVGENAELIRGEQVFRALHGIKRLILMNLGLNHALSRAVRFTMYVGPDIREGLSQPQLENKYKSNLFGRGYEHGDKTSVGCSYKGRLWSYRVAGDISEWVEWCHAIGDKLLDQTISVNEIFQHVIIPEPVTQRPELVPLVIQWSQDYLQNTEETLLLDVAGEVVPLFDVGIELLGHCQSGPIRFRVFTETQSVGYEVRFRSNSVEYEPTTEKSVEIIIARNRRSLSDWFQKNPPIILFENATLLDYNLRFDFQRGERTPFPKERIDAWDWTGTDLRKESQTVAKLSDSIQRRVIQEITGPDFEPQYDIVFDDDATHEVADVVAIKVAGDRLLVHLFHCKYSQEPSPGARVEDLYEVCGQAQRSVEWKGNIKRLIQHLYLREDRQLERHRVSRFERGDIAKLDEIARDVQFLIPEFKIFVVQPGLSRSKADTPQLELFAVTELYLQETFAAEFGVIASE